jgi:hypothetical protein
MFLSKNEPSISAYTQILNHKKEKKIKFGNRLPNNKVAFKNFHFFANFQTKIMSQNNSNFCCQLPNNQKPFIKKNSLSFVAVF